MKPVQLIVEDEQLDFDPTKDGQLSLARKADHENGSRVSDGIMNTSGTTTALELYHQNAQVTTTVEDTEVGHGHPLIGEMVAVRAGHEVEIMLQYLAKGGEPTLGVQERIPQSAIEIEV